MATIFPREEKAEQLFEKILENPDACERLKDTFYEHFPESEDMDAQMPAVSPQTFTRALFQAYQNKDLSAFLMAICGNSMFDLLRNSFLIPIRFDDKGKTNPILLTDDQGILREKLPVNVPDKVYQKFSRIYQHREPIPQMREYLAYGFREEHRYGEEDLSVESVEIGRHLGILLLYAMPEHLQKNPLGPLIILGVGGVDLTVPVEGEAQCLELLPEVVNILLGDDGRMDVVLHGEVLGGQTESVPAHGVQHIVAVFTALAAYHIQRGVAAGMADVQACTRRIRELHKGIELGFFVVDLDMEGLFVLPHLLPLGFNSLVIILHVCNQLQTLTKIPLLGGVYAFKVLPVQTLSVRAFALPAPPRGELFCQLSLLRRNNGAGPARSKPFCLNYSMLLSGVRYSEMSTGSPSAHRCSRS